MEVNVYTVNCLHYPFNTALRADCKSGASDDLAPTLMKTIDMLVSFIDKVMLLVFINQLVAPLRQIKLWSSILFLEKIRWTWEEALGRCHGTESSSGFNHHQSVLGTHCNLK